MDEVAGYYGGRLREHGATPQGVDWNGAESQFTRFRQLLKVLERDGPGSINDLGCGYGALLDEFDRIAPGQAYAGFDLVPAMVQEATARHGARPRTRFAVGAAPDAPADYGVASGIFNVRLDSSDESWWEVIVGALDSLHATSLRGFAFNCLTSYSDRPLMKPHLYYADPMRVFDHCKRRYSHQVALLHDYGLYEFTVIVRQDVHR
ncbi:class I SAM-dependent methyltransferase [Ramlibacter humi]|uniref:class I SAM-dependent methyltransferase n=1 Tax=Ramlibacter humi TaxID=2530451 RepID=UPI003F6ABBEA